MTEFTLPIRKARPCFQSQNMNFLRADGYTQGRASGLHKSVGQQAMQKVGPTGYTTGQAI